MAEAAGGDAAIALIDVAKRFPNADRDAVGNLSLDIHAGQITALIGPSGCGKTTTLKMINRLIEPTSGRILLEGTNVLEQDPVQLRRRIGYVIQTVGLLPHRTIEDNIGTVPRLLGWDAKRIAARVQEMAELFELDDDLLARYPGELSGGQRQRVGVARALAADPGVMLMDEPFAAVDPIVRGRLQEEFLSIQERLRKTIVFVTHDIDEAIKLADRIALLNVGGVLEQYAPPERMLREPANPFVEEFLGYERGLRRLALTKVGDIGVEEGPVVAPGTTAEEARRVMRAFGGDWASVVDGDELLGWIEESQLEGVATVSQVQPRRFSAYVTDEDSLRIALDSVVTSRTQVAVVVTEGQHYRGILTLEHISKEIVT
ncbi:MAG: ABC transporter ATP-binding protein [Actinomycetota bacterium]